MICYGQGGESAYLSNTAWLEQKDLKKWNKYLELLKEAETYMSKSNDTYLKMSLTESDKTINEKKKANIVKKLEKTAQEEYKTSLVKYKESYTGLYSIIQSYIGVEKENHPAYTEMISYEKDAKTLYSYSDKGETDEEREQLSKANESQLYAIEKGIQVLTTDEDNYQKPGTISTGAENLSIEDILVNEELYRKYKAYINDNSVPEPLGAMQLLQMEGEKVNMESFSEMWENYLSDKELVPEPATEPIDTALLAGADSLANDSVIDATSQQIQDIQYAEITNEVENAAIVYDQQVAKEKPSDIIPKNIFNGHDYEGDSDYEFRVQIAASRSALSLTQIKAIYKGRLGVDEVKEGNYYKYQIRGYKLLSDAQFACSRTGVDNAYIEAYRSSERVSLEKAVNELKGLESRVKKIGKGKAVNRIEFVVQVAASRTKLSEYKINDIYSGHWPITVKFEDGWYKYQINAGSQLQNAMNILDNCGVERAFLVSYKNGQKLLLYKALQEYKTYKP